MSIDIAKIEKAGRDIEAARINIQNLGEKRGQLFFQLKECEIVLEELKALDDTDKVFKMTGPTLVAEDLTDAKTNVQRRIDMISTQVKEVEKSIEAAQKELTAKEESLRAMSGQK